MRGRLQKGDIVSITTDDGRKVRGSVLKHNEDANTWFVFLDEFVRTPKGSMMRFFEFERKDITLVKAADERP